MSITKQHVFCWQYSIEILIWFWTQKVGKKIHLYFFFFFESNTKLPKYLCVWCVFIKIVVLFSKSRDIPLVSTVVNNVNYLEIIECIKLNSRHEEMFSSTINLCIMSSAMTVEFMVTFDVFIWHSNGFFFVRGSNFNSK